MENYWSISQSLADIKRGNMQGNIDELKRAMISGSKDLKERMKEAWRFAETTSTHSSAKVPEIKGIDPRVIEEKDSLIEELRAELNTLEGQAKTLGVSITEKTELLAARD